MWLFFLFLCAWGKLGVAATRVKDTIIDEFSPIKLRDAESWDERKAELGEVLTKRVQQLNQRLIAKATKVRVNGRKMCKMTFSQIVRVNKKDIANCAVTAEFWYGTNQLAITHKALTGSGRSVNSIRQAYELSEMCGAPRVEDSQSKVVVRGDGLFSAYFPLAADGYVGPATERALRVVRKDISESREQYLLDVVARTEKKRRAEKLAKKRAERMEEEDDSEYEDDDYSDYDDDDTWH